MHQSAHIFVWTKGSLVGKRVMLPPHALCWVERLRPLRLGNNCKRLFCERTKFSSSLGLRHAFYTNCVIFILICKPNNINLRNNVAAKSARNVNRIAISADICAPDTINLLIRLHYSRTVVRTMEQRAWGTRQCVPNFLRKCLKCIQPMLVCLWT